MDGTLLVAGLWHRFRRDRVGERWEDEIGAEIERVTATGDHHVEVLIPAIRSELGRRLEVVTRLMKDKGYRLHMVTPGSDLTWAAGYQRVPRETP